MEGFPTLFQFLVAVFGVKGWLGGGGIRREVVEVREGSRVVWIEET